MWAFLNLHTHYNIITLIPAVFKPLPAVVFIGVAMRYQEKTYIHQEMPAERE
ncbi:MAG: hypothetical protein ACYTF1_03100 [Planctomycetota bacterium]|jgi:hypothetical protein